MTSYEQNSVYQTLYGSVVDIKVVNLFIHQLDTATNYQVLPAVRPYQIIPDMNSLEALGRSAVSIQGDQTIGYTGEIARVSSGIIKLSDVATQLVDIPYSWQQERFGFICVLYINNNGRESIEVISGYTNYNGISYNQTPDPNMMFFINKITSINKNGMISAVDVLENTHKPVVTSNGFDLQPALPSTLVNEASTRLDPDVHAFNTVRAPSLSNLITGNINNNIPSMFLNTIVGGTLATKGFASGSNYGWTSDTSNMSSIDRQRLYSNVVSSVSTSDIRPSSFKSWDVLSGKLPFHMDNFGNSYMYFTLGTLSGICNQSIDQMRIIVNDNQPAISINNTEASLSATQIETIKAQSLFNTINSLALKHHLARVNFSIHYTPHVGKYLVYVNGVDSIVDIDGVDWTSNYVINSIGYFKAALEDYVNSYLTSDQRLLRVDVDYFLLANTVINISVDEQQPIMFVIPTYVSSAMSPTYNTQQQFNNLVESVSNVVDYFTGE